MRWLTVFLFLSAAFAQQEQDAQALARQMTAMHDAWGSRASTPNMKLDFVNQSHTGTEFRYRLRATGVPPESMVNLVSWPVTQRGPSEMLRGATFDDTGLAICAGRMGTCGDPAKPNDPIDLVFHPIPGEPVRVGVVSQDGAVKLFTKIVPLAIEQEDKGCRVSATLLTPGAELLFVEGTGFAPDSEISMNSESEGERHDAPARADAKGRYISALLPYKQGLTKGTVQIRLKAGMCSPMISVPWGKR